MGIKTVIGIDPGKSGGIAAWVKGEKCGAHKMPSTERDLWDLICSFKHLPDPFIWIEKLSPAPSMIVSQDGKMARGSIANWKLGENYGVLRGMIIASGIPSETVSPHKWCNSFGIKRKKTETQTAWKNRHKAKAQELFPHLKITHAVADALLIMEYGRRSLRRA